MNILTSLELDHITKKIPIEGDRFIVLIDTTEDADIHKKYGMKNIFCINSSNEIIWQISVGNSDKSHLKDTFMYMELGTEGGINADTFFGMEYYVDIKTGKAIRVGWHK